MQLSSLFLALSASATATLSMGAVIDSRDQFNPYDVIILAPSKGWTALVVTQTLPSGVMSGTTIQNDVAKDVSALTDDDRGRAAGMFRFTGAGSETREFWIDDANSGIHASVSFHIRSAVACDIPLIYTSQCKAAYTQDLLNPLPYAVVSLFPLDDFLAKLDKGEVSSNDGPLSVVCNKSPLWILDQGRLA